MSEIEEILNWYLMSGVDETIDNEAFSKKKVSNNENNSYNFIKKTILSPNDLVNKAREIANKCKSVEQLNSELLNFEGLSIKKTATNTVFADGNINSSVMAIGEAPGANEDIQGIPFCGVSGKLLDKMFASIGLYREKNLYITNSVFWRPPGNRRPTVEETAVCMPFVEKHISLINPKLLILVGATSAVSLLNSTETITSLRANTHYYHNEYLTQKIPVKAIFHPSYLLRQPSQKKLAWFDLLKIKKEFL